jgi:membrane protein implicated in regulation of membrane protease activity
METHLVFYVIAGLLLVTEAFTPGIFIFICFALATALAGLVDQLTNLTLTPLLGITLGLSLIFLFTVRPFLQMAVKIPDQSKEEGKAYGEKLVGREAMVFKAIKAHEPGVVKLIDFDETWIAKSVDKAEIGQGTAVIIEAIDGNHLYVRSLT